MKPVRNKSLDEAIVLLKIIDNNTLVVVDAKTTIRLLDKNSLEMIDGFKVKINHQYYKSRVTDFSSDGNYFTTLSADRRESKLYNAKSKRIVSKVDRHHGEVSCVGIDPLSRYMFSCGDDGKTFAIDVISGKIMFSLPLHADTINDIAFSDNGNLVATASFDRIVSLFNLMTMSSKINLKAHSKAVVKVLFLSKNRLLSIDKSSSVIIWDTNTGKVLHRIASVHDDVISVSKSDDEKFLFLGTVLGYVVLYDLYTYELLCMDYIKLKSSIISMVFNQSNKNLILGTKDGQVLSYDIFDGENELNDFLRLKQFSSIEKKVKDNPILTNTQAYLLMNKIWEKTLTNARIALQNGDKKKAESFFEFFKGVPSKNSKIQKIILEYDEFPKFILLVKQGKLSLAYSLANNHPMYKESKIYKSLEESWKKSFSQAQKCAIEPHGLQKAKDILAPYRGISEKTIMIQDLVTQFAVYSRFSKEFSQKKFKNCFELLKQNKFLKSFPEYGAITRYGDDLYIKVQELISSNDRNSASKILEVLRDFDDFKEDVIELQKEIDNKQKFFNAEETDDKVSAYNIMSKVESLVNSKYGKQLQVQWNKDLEIANTYASKGDSAGVKKSLNNYMKTSSKYVPIATVFSWCFMVQLEDALNETANQVRLENGIKNYIKNFSKDENIEYFFDTMKKKYEKSKLNFELLPQGSLCMWKPSMIVDSILD